MQAENAVQCRSHMGRIYGKETCMCSDIGIPTSKINVLWENARLQEVICW